MPNLDFLLSPSTYYFAEVCRFIIRKLPAWLCYFLANVAGNILYLFWSRARRNIKENVATVLGSDAEPAVVRRIARQCMRNFCKYVVDFFRFSSSQTDIENGKITIHGLENLDMALKEGKGAILVSFHMGNFDVGAKLISEQGYSLNVVADTQKIRQLDRFVRKWRAKSGVRLVAKEEVSKMVEVLRRNKLLALLIDCPEHDKGIEVKFGNKSAKLPAGAAILALRTKAKVIPCGLVRSSNNTFMLFINEHINFQSTGNLAKDIKELTQQIVSTLEETARQFPDQWYMFSPLLVSED
jgi:Kdo2-lipid IVA lauroyltransferase/acyltransferase